MYFNFIGQNQNIEFASRWKKALSPDSVAQGKATGQRLAMNKKDVAAGIYTKASMDTDLTGGIKKGKELSAKGKQAMLTKAASPNRTMRPTTQRGNLRAAPARSQLSSKSAQSFKQGAQNQATNTANANKARMQDSVNKTLKQGKYAPPPTTSSASSWTPPKSKVKVPVGSIGDDVRQAMGSKGGMADDIAKGVGRKMLKRNIIAGGVGLAVAGGVYAAQKAKQKKQNRFF